MSGNQEFRQIIASAAQEKLVISEQVVSSSLAAGASETINFYAPSNSVIKVIGLYITYPAPVGASSGTQEVWIGFQSPQVLMAYAKGSYNELITFIQNVFSNNGSAEQGLIAKIPSDEAALIAAITNITYDSNIPLQFIARNNTNVAQTGTRTFRVAGMQRTIAVG